MTKSNESISVVFPAYNEESNIVVLIDKTIPILKEHTDTWEIIIVNDGSTDRTAEVVQSYRNKNLSLINHPFNKGYGAAIKSGIAAAKNDLIFFSDSDLQFDISELNNLLSQINKYDIVIGYRKNRRDPFMRRLNAFGWNILIKSLFDLKVKDINCAFKVFKRHVFDKISVDADGAMINTDIIAQAVKYGFTIKEVPVTHYPRLKGQQTGAHIKVIFKAFKELFQFYRKLKKTT
jgi:glycosyltransferase involved in cell wall biosynthesis